MRARELLTEATKVGREWQHLEDLVFVDGSQGALNAANILKNLGSGATELNIKWDGRIALYWGREPDGTFVLVGKNGWGKERYTTPADMQNAITTAGKGEDWRQKLGADMAQVFDIMEKTPLLSLEDTQWVICFGIQASHFKWLIRVLLLLQTKLHTQ